MKKRCWLYQVLFLGMIGLFLGFMVPQTQVSAETAAVEDTAAVADAAADTGEGGHDAGEEDEINFFLFFALGIVLLLAVVAAVVTVIVSGTVGAVIISDEE